MIVFENDQAGRSSAVRPPYQPRLNGYYSFLNGNRNTRWPDSTSAYGLRTTRNPRRSYVPDAEYPPRSADRQDLAP